MKPRDAVCLLSGGLDSATVLALAKAQGYRVHALSFDYGQRHRIELDRARAVATALGAADHKIVTVDLTPFGGSALTSATPVPKRAPDAPVDDGIPVTYVPARNTVFLSLALAYAETLGTGDLFIGVNALDYSGYPDCRPAYLAAFEAMANLATRGAVEGSAPVRLHAPLIAMTKGEIIQEGLRLGVDYGLTLSCYDPASDGTPCGRCDSCRL
ncbi:MAG: 7-cyano-7-deazaguanine synthase QueC, partial [Nitrospinae bacterium]|nr:7-cyano-7-deazaguanine synthase QueC [Nitrospinota bacterium]